MNNKKIILASSSPRRVELLKKIGIDFDVFSLNVDENIEGFPKDIVQVLAKRKCMAVVYLFSDHYVLGADTLVALDNTAIGKPKDNEDAYNILKRLDGKSHSVYTGICLYSPKSKDFIVDVEETTVVFKDYSDDDILNYIATGEPLDKAGAYAIQGIGSSLVQSVNGSISNVIGLPVEKLSKMLYNCGLINYDDGVL